MKITYLIGNGFDLNLGLKTSYQHFYTYYLNIPSKNDIINIFKNHLSRNIHAWADLEMKLGEYSKNIYNESDYLFILDDILDNLAEYLANINNSIINYECNSQKLTNDLLNLQQYLAPQDSVKVTNLFKKFASQSYEVNIVTFNYTNTFETVIQNDKRPYILRKRSFYTDILQDILHLHGTTNYNMILGVNDISQIQNIRFQSSPQICRSIIKAEMNDNAGTLNIQKVKDYIAKSDLICIFGMSIGPTDKMWWQEIANKIKNSNTILVIFDVDSSVTPRKAYKVKDIKEQKLEKFFSYSQLTDEEKRKIDNQTILALNTEMFKFLIKAKEKNLELKKEYDRLIKIYHEKEQKTNQHKTTKQTP